MLPKHIIELAIKGGWMKHWDFQGERDDNYIFTSDVFGKTYLMNRYQVVCDPLFWQSLGKELDWRTVGPARNQNDHEPDWYWNARKFFDLLLTSGDTSAFWQSISDKK